jgi:pyrimidine operon attenuation protein / uracil phosphoribosyltransferase
LPPATIGTELMPQLLDREGVVRALRRIAHEILERHRGAEDLVLLGIRTRGVHLARMLQGFISDFEGVDVPVGGLDITPFRDDGLRRSEPEAAGSDMPDVDGHPVVIVDDVLYTGRTVRAAMDAVADLGRASRIELAVLVDRGHRELPLRPDYVGKNTPSARNERVSVHVEEVDGDLGVWIEKAAL